MSPTPMGLVLPTEGGSNGTWGSILATVFNLLENHSHESGKGVPIPSSALGINGDTNWASYALRAAKAITFSEVATSAMTSYVDALYVDSSTHNLTFRNSAGVPVVLTNGDTINMTLIGGWLGDYTSVSAAASYDDSSRNYWLQQELVGGLRPWAGLQTGDVSIFQKAVSIVNKVTLKSPNALAASYTYTFPATVPAASQMLTVGAGGQLAVDGVLGNNVNVKLQGTGYVQNGDRHRTILFLPTSPVVAAGSVANNGGNFGAVVAASSTVYFPLGNVSTLERIKQVTIRLGNTPANAVSYAFYFGQASLGGVSWALIGSGTSSAANSIVLTPNGPYTGGITPNPFDTVWIQVVVPSATTCTMALADILYDVP